MLSIWKNPRFAQAMMLCALLVAAVPGCEPAKHDHDHDHDREHDDHDHDHDHGDSAAEGGGGHVHHAPHGGTLVVLGEEALHLEVLLDRTTGSLTAYVLDGEAEQPIRIEQPGIELNIEIEGGEPFFVNLAATARELTGETVGDTSEFRGQDERLVGQERFAASIHRLEALGQRYSEVRFPFPEGNE